MKFVHILYYSSKIQEKTISHAVVDSYTASYSFFFVLFYTVKTDTVARERQIAFELHDYHDLVLKPFLFFITSSGITGMAGTYH